MGAELGMPRLSHHGRREHLLALWCTTALMAEWTCTWCGQLNSRMAQTCVTCGATRS